MADKKYVLLDDVTATIYENFGRDTEFNYRDVSDILKLIPTADVVPKAKFDEAMELLKNSAPFANSYSGWWSIQKYQDRYEKLLQEVDTND